MKAMGSKRLQELWNAAEAMIADHGQLDPQTGERVGYRAHGPVLMEPLEVQRLVEQIWALEEVVFS